MDGGHVDKITAPEDAQALIPGTHDYTRFHGEGQFAGGMKAATQLISQHGVGPVLSAGARGNHKVP